MKSRIAIICVALVSVFFIACPMPQVGVGTTKDATGADQTAPQAAGGSISVVNDEARNQAVYINEAGQRFDVVAPEYPGGPLVACVEVADFTLVPPSTDSDALPVKALVAGTRNDGTPGVWEIHSDDTIDLPQPAVDDSGNARCIVGGDMNTLPDGVQIRYGWGFHVTAVSADGKMIVGYADNPKGVTIGGVQIQAGTTIGVYWRVYSLPYSRFCIVSAPHILGSFVKQPLPAKWAAHWPGRSSLLEQLRLFFAGTLQSYLVKPTSVHLDVPQGITAAAATSTGTYDVLGINEDGLPASATIDKNGGVAIQVLVPDLAVSAVTVSTSTVSVSSASAPAASVFTDDPWSVSATLTNEGTAQATSVVAQYWLSSSATFDPTTAKLIDTSATIPSLQVGQTITITSPQTYSLSRLGITTAGTYYIVVTVAADPKNGEIDLSDNAAQASITAQVRQTATVDLTVSASSVAPVDLFGMWSFNATVTNNGTGTAGPSTLDYSVNGKVTQVPVGSIGPNGSQVFSLSGKASFLTSTPGTVHITLTADALNTVAETNENNNTADVVVTVTYVDLTVRITPVTPVHLGGIWSSSATVINGGTGTAGPTTLEYLVNGNATTIPVGSLAPGASQSFSLSGNVSDLTLASGTYHVSVIADALNAVVELNEGNNTADLVVPVIYDEIVLDTYNPTDPTGLLGPDASNYMELWSSDGSTLLAYDDGGSGSSRPPSQLNQLFAYLDYRVGYSQSGVPVGNGLPPGDYFVRVRASSPGDLVPYAIRVLDQPNNSYQNWTLQAPTNTGSDNPTTGGPDIRAAYQTLVFGDASKNRLSREVPGALDGNNWVKITLP